MIGSQPDKQGNYMSCKHDLANGQLVMVVIT